MNKNGKRYSDEFKADAMSLVKEGRSISSVAKDLGISYQSLRNWLNVSRQKQDPEASRILELEAQLKAEKPIPGPSEDRVSINYLKQLESLPLLHEQGDGMRSFVGVLLNSFMSYNSVLLIDEPEAFLHPPRARLLGKMLARDLPRGRQLFLATHSGDFLRGLLDANTQNIKIVRIQRNGDINNVSLLNKQDINIL